LEGTVLTGTLAHEFDHVSTLDGLDEMVDDAIGPEGEAREIAADRYAYRWGFKQEIDPRSRRVTQDITGHRLAPSGRLVPTYGLTIRYRVTDDLSVEALAN
jgi:hypothetical protein